MSFSLATPSLPWSTLIPTLIAAYILFYVVPSLLPSQALRHIPTVGCRSDSFIDFWIGAFKSLKNGNAIVKEGYSKFQGRPFKVPTLSGWMVIAASPEIVQDLKSAREEDLSLIGALDDTMQLKYTLGEKLGQNTYHVNVIRTPLTRNIQSSYPEIRDEILTSWDEEIDVPDDSEWHQVPIIDRIMRIICRTSNRLFVGLPICRNPEYIKLNTEFTVDVMKTAVMLNMFPKFLRRFVGPILGPLPANLRLAHKMLDPTVSYRLEQFHKYGKDWEGKPNDLITWLIEYADESVLNIDSVVNRVLMANFAAIHTTSMAFTNAIYDLAARPEYIEPLRAEIESVIDEEGGWSKAAIGKMKKLDSFVRESQRHSGAPAVSMSRKARRDYTFHDGTTIPAGSHIGLASLCIQLDGQFYSDPTEFDGFRFASMQKAEGDGTKYHSSSPDASYFVFGLGRHACPGRFFAILEVKNLLAHVILNYDIKFEDRRRPENEWFFTFTQPSSKVAVLMKKRKTTAVA